MYIEAVPNRSSPPAILLRESYRQNGKVHKRTLCNLSDWPVAHIEGLRGVLKGGTVIPVDRDAFTVTRSLPHDHVAAALDTAHQIGLDRIRQPVERGIKFAVIDRAETERFAEAGGGGVGREGAHGGKLGDRIEDAADQHGQDAVAAAIAVGTEQLSLFDQRDMASITSPDFPGERLVVYRNPDLAAERARKREEPLVETETDLGRIKAAVERKRNPLRGTAEIALKVGEVLNTHKMKKHFDRDISDAVFRFVRKTAEIADEAATDGVVRTSLAAATLGDIDTIRSYKSLSLVERAFRCIKTVDLHVRPVYHWLEGRVRLRHGEVKPDQIDDGADQPFGLPQPEAKDQAHRQRRGDCQGR